MLAVFLPTSRGATRPVNGTSILFGLPGLRVRSVDRVPAGRVVHVVTDEPAAAACPVCGVLSTTVRQRRATNPKDVGYGEEPLVVRWHKVQYSCVERACPRVAFTESIRQLPPGARVTGRLRRAAGAAVAAGASVAAVVRAQQLNWPVVRAAFVVHADARLAPPAPVVEEFTIKPAMLTVGDSAVLSRRHRHPRRASQRARPRRGAVDPLQADQVGPGRGGDAARREVASMVLTIGKPACLLRSRVLLASRALISVSTRARRSSSGVQRWVLAAL